MKYSLVILVAIVFASVSRAGQLDPGRFDGKYKLASEQSTVTAKNVVAKPCMPEIEITHYLNRDATNIVRITTLPNQDTIKAYDTTFFEGTPDWKFVREYQDGDPIASEADFFDQNKKMKDCSGFIMCQIQNKLTGVSSGKSFTTENSIGGTAQEVFDPTTVMLAISLTKSTTGLVYKLKYKDNGGKDHVAGSANVTCNYSSY